jgi:glycosyltransferase involved in cell wall biosynthesis
MDQNLTPRNPQISVVIAAYNTGQYIGRTLDSLLQQTFSDFEVIVVDDCSADNTATIVKDYQTHDSRIILIDNERNSGQCISRNRGMAIARGKYIAILDADDLSAPERLAVQFAYLETHPEITLVGAQGTRIDENDQVIGEINVPTDPLVIKYRLITENVLIQSSIFFRKNEILSIGGYDKDYQHVEDFDLYSRLIKNNFIILNLPQRLVSYRQRQGSVLSSSASHRMALKNVYPLIYNNVKVYVPLNEEQFARYYHAYLLKDFNTIPLADLWLSLRVNHRILRVFLNQETLTAARRSDVIATYRLNRQWNIKRYFVDKFRTGKRLFKKISNQ